MAHNHLHVPLFDTAQSSVSMNRLSDGEETRPSKHPAETIGDRIRRHRKAKGLTQTELGQRVGLSQRLMTYYETQGGTFSPDPLLRFASELEVPVNVLIGAEAEPHRVARPNPAASVRLWRRFQRLEQLPEQDRKTVLKMIDALVNRSRRRRVGRPMHVPLSLSV